MAATRERNLSSFVPFYGGVTVEEQLCRESLDLGDLSLRAVVDDYIRYYAKGDGHTAKAKRIDLRIFLDYLSSLKGKGRVLYVCDWTHQSTKDFLDYLAARGEAPATISRRLATLKHFGRTLAERVSSFVNPARELRGPVIATTRPKGLSDGEISFLYEIAAAELAKAGGDFAVRRNVTMLYLLLATGLRADEVRLLNISQVTEDLSWLEDVKTKGRRYRKVYLDSFMRVKLREYLLAREVELRGKCPELFEGNWSGLSRLPVFISLYGAKVGDCPSFALSPKSVWRIIANFGKLAIACDTDGDFGKLHPHKLRHTFAHGLLDSSRDLRLVAQALGHSDVRTTMRYTERSDLELASAIEEARKKSGG